MESSLLSKSLNNADSHIRMSMQDLQIDFLFFRNLNITSSIKVTTKEFWIWENNTEALLP